MTQLEWVDKRACQGVISDEAYLELAEKISQHAEAHGIVAAESFIDSISKLNMTPEVCHEILLAVEQGEGLESLPSPNLSGEWADDPTPYSLREEIGAGLGDWVWACDDLIEEWEFYAQVAYLDTLETILRDHLVKVGW